MTIRAGGKKSNVIIVSLAIAKRTVILARKARQKDNSNVIQ